MLSLDDPSLVDSIQRYPDQEPVDHVCAFSPLGLDQGVDMYHVNVRAYFGSLFCLVILTWTPTVKQICSLLSTSSLGQLVKGSVVA